MRLAIAAAIAAIGLSSAVFAQTPPAPGGNTEGATLYTPREDYSEAPTDYRTNMDRSSIASAVYLPSGNPVEISEAFAAAKLAGVECQRKDAALVSRKGKVITYEIACDRDFGWIVSSKDAGKSYAAYECLALATSSKANKGGLATCHLAANAGSHKGIDALAVKAGLSCPTVDKYAYLGSGGAMSVSRYELACGANTYLIDTPTPGSKAAMQVIPCKEAVGVCTLKR